MRGIWPTKVLGEVCQLISGQHIDAKDYNTQGRGVGYLTGPSDFGAVNPLITKWTEHPKVKAKRGDVLITVKGSGVGKINLLDEAEVAISRQLMAIRVIGADPRFVHAILSSTFDHFQALSTGAAIPGISRDQVLGLPIPLPPLPEQQRIVAILDEAFDGIATAKANAEKNLQNARAIFESHLQSVFSQRGPGWVTLEIGAVAEIYDGPHATPKTVEKGPLFLGISALQDGKINLGETRHVTPDDFKHWTRRVTPQTDDVVFSYETRLGQAAIIPSGLSCCLGRRMGLVRANREKMSPLFFVYQYISPPFREFLNSRTVRGATVDRIPLKDFPSFPISLPTLDEQERLGERFESIRAQTEILTSIYERKRAALDALKKSLLHRAFAGELTADKTSELIEAVA